MKTTESDVMKPIENLHECSESYPHEGYGAAVDVCFENESGELWAGNDEYWSQVDFCPFCGYEAPKRVRERYPKWLPTSIVDIDYSP